MVQYYCEYCHQIWFRDADCRVLYKTPVGKVDMMNDVPCPKCRGDE